MKGEEEEGKVHVRSRQWLWNGGGSRYGNVEGIGRMEEIVEAPGVWKCIYCL